MTVLSAILFITHLIITLSEMATQFNLFCVITIMLIAFHQISTLCLQML